MEEGSWRNIFNNKKKKLLQLCFLCRHWPVLVNVAVITPQTPLKTHKHTTVVETQGNRRHEWTDLKWVICNEYALILTIACKHYEQVISPLRGKDKRCAHLDQDYLQLYNTVHEIDSGAVGMQTDKLLVFWWGKKTAYLGLKVDKNRALGMS